MSISAIRDAEKRVGKLLVTELDARGANLKSQYVTGGRQAPSGSYIDATQSDSNITTKLWTKLEVFIRRK